MAQEIVISGIAGRFPASDNIREYRDNLYNKVNMIGETDRWNVPADMARKFGFLKNVDKFDHGAFGVNAAGGEFMDPQVRMMCENVYEALLDAGVSPESIRGTNTGVYVGCLCLDAMDRPLKNDTYGFAAVGYAKFSFPNRISYTFNLTGPSLLVDTACSSSFYALTLAYEAIKRGDCESALVIGTALIYSPYIMESMQKSKIINSEGKSQPFDINAAGYVRGESVSVIYLQKEAVAKRIYATIVNTKINNEGFKEAQTVPSVESQIQLYRTVYEDERTKQKNVHTHTIDYLEAHSTSTQAGDKQEIASIDQYFCTNRINGTPLKIGSVKGNIGHAEGASGLASLIKSILMFENEKIIPNINITQLREDCPALENRIHVVQEVEKFEGKTIGINNFGLLGSNAHAIFQRNEKSKNDGGFPSDNIPRLLLWSGRTEEAVNTIFDKIGEQPLDDEFLALLQSSQTNTSSVMNNRGFAIFKADENRATVTVDRQVKYSDATKRPIVFVYSGVGSQWKAMGRDLMRIPVLEKSIQECHEICKKINVNLIEMLTSEDSKDFKYWYPVGITAIQLILTDLLKLLGIEPDFMVGHSLGELGCGYADSTLTKEETLFCSYYRGFCILEKFADKGCGGAMAAIGLNHQKILELIPAGSGIEVVCHNSIDSSTIAGMAEPVNNFVNELRDKKIFAVVIDSEGVPYHTSYIHCLRQSVFDRLHETIKTPKLRSPKWISSSIPKSSWNSEIAKYSSPEYHTNNMMSPVLFEEALAELPENSFMIELAPHGLFQSILRKSFPKCELGSLMKKNSPDNVIFLLQSLGKLFQNGIDLDIRRIYPKIDFPVSRSTEMISPLIKWDHEKSYFVPTYETQSSMESKNAVTVSLKDPKYEYFKGHVIDGKILLPATGYLMMVWEVFAKMHGLNDKTTPFLCENVKLMKPIVFGSIDHEVTLMISIQKANGRFEVTDSKGLIVEGVMKNATQEKYLTDMVSFTEEDQNSQFMSGDDFYRELVLRGYKYDGEFRSIAKVNKFQGDNGGVKFHIKHREHIAAVMDNLLHMGVLFRDTRDQLVPTGIRRVYVNFEDYNKSVEEALQEAIVNGENEDEVFLPAYNNEAQMLGRCSGIELIGLSKRLIAKKKSEHSPIKEVYKFVPHLPTPKMSLCDASQVAIQLLLDRTMLMNVKAVEIDNETGRQPLIEHLTNAIDSFPMISADSHYLTQAEGLEMKNVNITKDSISEYSQIDICVISDSMEGEKFMRNIMKMQEYGLALLRERKFIENLKLPVFLSCIAIIPIDDDWIYVLRKAPTNLNVKKAIEIPSSLKSYKWMAEVKEVLASENVPLVLHSDQNCSGILGFFNCLKREMAKKQLQCVFIDDAKAPKFDMENELYKNQLDLGLLVNVYKNGKWGSYRHLNFSVDPQEMNSNDHYFAHLAESGDLSSLTWMTGELSPKKDDVINVHYSGLNFRDVMVATSRISLDFEFQNRIKRQYQLGFEFSGQRKDGSRVMGITTSRAFSNFVLESEALLLDVPQGWSLEEAATVPLVYITVYYAFFVCTQIKKGQSILIHAGSGGLGISAIRVALSYGLEVFTTVSTPAKKQFLLAEFPELKAENIGNSRDCTFETMVKQRTNGLGVNYVLNSLAEAKMQATVRCLAENGVFLEVGKFDMLMGNKISLEVFLQGIEFKAVLINTKTMNAKPHVKAFLTEAINKDIQLGIIKPLRTTIFPANDIEKAFRYIATAKHIGKILIQIRDGDSMLPIKAKKLAYFDSDKSYVITGGLGGMGLELADWMILRNCKKLILSSSRGLSSDYQKYKIHEIWESYGVEVVVSTADISTRSGCEDLLREAEKLGPVGGIFNLAGITCDGLFEKMSEDIFHKVMQPKAHSAHYLDELTRTMCPQLNYFVAFSSIACGFGNGGQTNYGYANSVLERIVEKRKAEGLPGKAIQWGPVADVGMLAKRGGNLESFGLISQSVDSCFSLLDDFLAHESAVVTSYVKKESKKISKSVDSVFNHIVSILGVSEKKGRSADLDVPLSEYGLDSLTGAELEVMLERELGVTLKLQELRSSSINQIKAVVIEMVNSNNNQ